MMEVLILLILVQQKMDVIQKWNLDKVDFSEGDLHNLKIVYQNDELSLQLENEQLRSSFKFSKHLNLELGRCFIGIVNEGENGQVLIDLCSWKMVGFNVFNNEDSWNGLSLRYKIEHPLSLLISPSLQEKMNMLFRYFFPIRHIQYELS